MTSRQVLLIKCIFAVMFAPMTILMFLPVLLLLVAAVLQLATLQSPVASFFFLLWPASGMAGIAGFWTWVFFPRSLSRKRRFFIGTTVFSGIVAASPIAFGAALNLTRDWETASLLLAGWIAGITVCLWMIFPAFPCNPNRFQPAPSAISSCMTRL